MLLLAAVFALFVWWNHKDGVAVVDAALEADRRTNPIGFWIAQVMWGALAIITGVMGVLAIVGVLRV